MFQRAEHTLFMVIAAQIKERLEELVRRERRLRLWRGLAIAWGAAAAGGLFLLFVENESGWRSLLAMPLIAWIGAIAAAIVFIRYRQPTTTAQQLDAPVDAPHS